jgi:error-prone DNA polymerase
MYTPLFCKSNFSFLEGASHPGELVEEAAEQGLEALALCDRDGLYGVVQAHQKAREVGVDLIVGSQVTIDDGSTIVLLAGTRAGYGNLCRVLTRGQRRTEKGESEVGWEEVCEHAGDVIALWGGRESRLTDEEPPEAIAEKLRAAFGDRLYAMLTRHRRTSDPEREARTRQRARRWELPLVAAHEVLYHDRARRPLQDILVCIDHGVTIHEAGSRTAPNAEHALKSPEEFEQLFEDAPLPVRRTMEIAERCEFSLDDIHYRYPSQDLPDGTSSSDRLRDLTYRGARRRYGENTTAPGEQGCSPQREGPPSDCSEGIPALPEADDVIPDDVREQIEEELELIEELEYCGYFLSMHEIVGYCRRRNILCQGRGSAANSAVCYCLGITAIDPVRMDLLFERFISRERGEPPDIDLDIEHDRREEVLQWVYDKYGRDRAAMVANVIRYRPKSAVRDVGKALGLPETGLDRMAKLIGRGEVPERELLEQAGLDPNNRTHALLLACANELLEFPRHLSIHPGGFVLGADPVSEIVPIENGAKEGRTVIQWDKYDIKEMGLFKVDLLGLGALTQLHNCFDLLAEYHGVELTLDEIPEDDEATYDMICEADTVGVFQIESRAQMSMLPRLKPRNYYDLVVEVSIVRPGPITGEMVHPYLRRRTGEEEVTYPHPTLEPVLEKTLGVPLFQEQVMKLAVVAADYTPGEADQLRRDMGSWREDGRMERHRQRMISRMLDKGIDKAYAERIVNQIQGFGSYGFPESHAASFALISYATSYLKCHYPAAFACALLNAQPMGFYSPATVVEDAKRHDVEVRAVDVQHSAWDCTLEPCKTTMVLQQNNVGRASSPSYVTGASSPVPGFALRMGLRLVKGFRQADWQSIAAAREERPFEGLEDFLHRTGLGEGAVATLAEAGAFESFNLSRREALWLGRGLVRTPDLPLEVREAVDETRPAFESLETFETINWDYRSTGHSPRGHPLAPLRDRLEELGLPTAEQVREADHGSRLHYAGLVICRQRPSTGSGTVFITLEDETGFANLIIWPDIYERYAAIAKTQHFLGATGEVESDEGVTHLVVESLWRPDLEADPEHGGSYDFH